MKKKYFTVYLAPYGISIAPLGECENLTEASKAANYNNYTNILHICDEGDIRGLLGSIKYYLNE